MNEDKGRESLDLVSCVRGVAALCVVFSHAVSVMGRLWPANAIDGIVFAIYGALELFFVLSGFMMFWAHGHQIGRREYFAGFLSRRFLRIYPAYWAALLIALALLALKGQAASPEWTLQSILLFGEEDRSPLAVAWTLYHEVLFYLVFAVMIWDRRLGLALAATWGLSGLVAPSLHYAASPLNLLFLAGVSAAYATRRGWLRLGWASFWAGTGAMLAGASMLWTPSGSPFPHIIIAVGAGMTLSAAVTIERAERPSLPAWLVFVGQGSYGLYLAHLLPMVTIGRLAGWVGLPPLAALCAMLAGGLVLGLLFHRFVERQMVAALRRPRTRAPVAA